MKKHDKNWTKLNNLLSHLINFKVIELVKSHNSAFGNSAPAELIEDSIEDLSVILNSCEEEKVSFGSLHVGDRFTFAGTKNIYIKLADQNVMDGQKEAEYNVLSEKEPYLYSYIRDEEIVIKIFDLYSISYQQS